MRPDNPGNKIRGIVALPHGAVNTRPVQPGTQRVTVISLSPDECWANSLPSTAGPSGSLSSSSIAQSLLTALYLLVQQVPFIASKDRHGTTRRRSWLILCPPGYTLSTRSSVRARSCSSLSDQEADEWYLWPTPSPTGLRRALLFGGEAFSTSIGDPAPWVFGL